MINYYDSIYDKAMTQSVTADTEKKRAVASVLKVFHETVRTAAAPTRVWQILVEMDAGLLLRCHQKKNPKRSLY